MSLDKLLTSFARFGSNKGLRFVFRDPRAIAPATRAIGDRVDDGKIASPIILEAEVAAGPEGYLPEMSVIAGDALDPRQRRRHLHGDVLRRVLGRVHRGGDAARRADPRQPVARARLAAARRRVATL